MIIPIMTPEDFVRIIKREMLVRAWITLGRRRIMLQTAKHLYSDEFVSLSLTQEGKAVIVLKCGVVIRVDYYVQGRTMFIENMNRADDVVVI